MNEDKLNAILSRCEKSSKGPWRAFIEGKNHTSGSSFIMTGEGDIEIINGSNEDYEFIANAKQDIPLLIKEITRLKLEISNLKSK